MLKKQWMKAVRIKHFSKLIQKKVLTVSLSIGYVLLKKRKTYFKRIIYPPPGPREGKICFPAVYYLKNECSNDTVSHHKGEKTNVGEHKGGSLSGTLTIKYIGTGRRLYQYNEDDFRFDFDWYQAFKKHGCINKNGNQENRPIISFSLFICKLVIRKKPFLRIKT